MVTQRPGKLDADSLSQCLTQITMRIINPTDQQQIAQSKDAPALWAAAKKYEEKHRAPEVKADEEMDVGV